MEHVYIVFETNPGDDRVVAVFGSAADAQDFAKRRNEALPDHSRLHHDVEEWEVREGL